ncbi:polymer-forming cytoskeletal protein [Geminicoccaceae bacterium 1502E]|nr:polymer-forming cytoskeletal protein [Geminicoccaceae bacterium 1502E]
MPEQGYGQATSEPRAPAAPQPELPRRQIDVPAAPGAGSSSLRPQAAPPGQGMKTDAGGKQLMVGEGISLAGEITACDLLVVQGSVQVTLNQTRAIEIAESGRFTNGKAEVEEAVISGVYEGDLTVRKRLMIRSTGRVQGTVRYGELEIERGGRLTGNVSMLEDSAPAAAAAE